MSDILDKIVAVKRDEVAAALAKKPLAMVRADAESRVAQLDYPAALDRLKAAQDMLRFGQAGVAGRNAHIDASIIDTRTRQISNLIREQTREDKVDR